MEARRLFRVCGGPACSPTQQRLCASWLADVDARVPSVVLSAKDGLGVDLVDVKVTMDGAPIAARLDGRAIDVDPGPHTFVFVRPDGTKAETSAVAVERGKGSLVVVRYQGSPPPPPLAAPIEASPQPLPASNRGGGWRTAGVVVGAAGLAGLILGGTFGGLALATKGAHCDKGLCDPGSASTAYTEGSVSTVGFVAGGALLAGGVAMFLLAPRGGAQESALDLRVAPALGPGRSGVELAGRW